MKIQMYVSKKIDVKLMLNDNEEHLLSLWMKNSFNDEDFLNTSRFKRFCKGTIGGENYIGAKAGIDFLNNKVEELKKDGYEIDYDYFLL